jgi:cyanophycinase
MKKILLIVIAFLAVQLVIAQFLPGSLLVVGGGSESIGGWSDQPYTWAVEQSDNKRVAIIGANSGPSDWLPNYFMDQCGAVYARNFVIPNSATANSQNIYDSLITYDVIFLRGGDQYDYYSEYKGTLTEDAITEVFQTGGVIGGTSAGLHVLSEVDFIARYGTVYPEEALENPLNQYMTLANDFMDLSPDMIFDSHVAERARFGRIIGFMGNWNLEGHEDIIGVGVDDKTALCISNDFQGSVYGTGAVSIYFQGENNTFSISGDKLLATDLTAMQLLHECTIDFNNLTFDGLELTVTPAGNEETFPGYLWLSGSDDVGDNYGMLDQLIGHQEGSDTILIITGSETGIAHAVAGYIENEGAKAVMFEPVPSNGNNNQVEQWISSIGKYLFVDNSYISLNDFMKGTANGILMNDLIESGLKAVAFMGGDSRYAGKTVIRNYDQEYASYDGLLDLREGLGLLKNTIVVPNTFSSSIDMENAATGLPFGMITDSIRFGIWLFDNNFAQYQPLESRIELTSYGDFPMILVENRGTLAGFATQPASSTGNPRNIAGFGEFSFRLMDETMSVTVGSVGAVGEKDHYDLDLFYPNPASENISVRPFNQERCRIFITTMQGTTVYSSWIASETKIRVDEFAPGIYLVQWADFKGKILHSNKLIIQ